MKLLPLHRPELLERVASWLAEKENYQWLDFGGGRQIVTPTLLKIMTQQDTHFMRAYTLDQDDTPLGILGLTNVNRSFKTAMFWAVAGEKSFRTRGYGTIASSKFLSLAFSELGLHVINTWAVENNPSLRGLGRLGFRFIGRQRQCHYIDGRLYDRLLLDLLASEHRELDETRWLRIERSRREADCEQLEAQPG